MYTKIFTIKNSIAAWVLYVIFYYVLKTQEMHLTAALSTLICQASLDLAAAYFSYQLAYLIKQKRIVFLFMFISFLFACLSDLVFNFVVNILHTETSSFLSSLFDIPFSFFLLFQFFAWLQLILGKNILSGVSKHTLFSIALFLLIVLSIFFLFLPWKTDSFSVIFLPQLLDNLLEILCFLMGIFYLAVNKDTRLTSIAIGFLLILASYFLYNAMLASIFYRNNVLEVTWILGLLLMFSGLVKLRYGNKLDSNDYLYSAKSLHFQLTFWAFNFVMLLLGIFFFITFLISFNHSWMINLNMENLPPVLVFFLIITTLICNLVTKKWLSPIERVKKRISDFSNKKDMLTARCFN